MAKAELQRLQAQVGELAPMAQNYGELKDRIATIELDAHRKAQATVDEAEGQAEALREETRQWLARVLEEHGALRREMDGMFAGARALAELEQQAARTDELAAALREKAGAK